MTKKRVNVTFLSSAPFGYTGGIANYVDSSISAFLGSPNFRVSSISYRLVNHLSSLKSRPSGLFCFFASSKLLYPFIFLYVAIRFPPNILVATHVNFLFLAALFQPLFGYRLFLFCYGVDAWQPCSRVQRLSLRFVHHCIFISRFSLQTSSQSGLLQGARSSLPISILPPCINLFPNFALTPLFSKSIHSSPLILTISRLSLSDSYKGIDLLIQSISLLYTKYPSIHLAIIGEGDDQPRLSQLVKSLNLSAHVTFIGFASEAIKHQLLSSADVFALPSTKEGFGIVFLEALQYGLPIIAGNIDGSVEALENGKYGTLIDPTNLDMLVHEIDKSVLKTKACPVDLPRYSYTNFSSQLLRLFSDL